MAHYEVLMTDLEELDKMTTKTNAKSNDSLRWVLVVGLVLVAFFGAYKFASARSGLSSGVAAAQAGVRATSAQAAAGAAGSASRATSGQTGAASSGAGCACCGGGGAPTTGGVTGPPTTGTASVAGGVQKVSVEVTTVYNPNTIKLKAGVPAEITFSRAQGCTQVVQSIDLGFSEDLSAGPKTVKLDGLRPGTYAFSCGMQMVFGKIVVE
jgi:plastocyanin